MRVIFLAMTTVVAAHLAFAASSLPAADEKSAGAIPFSSLPSQPAARETDSNRAISQEQAARVQAVLQQACGKPTEHITVKELKVKLASNPAMPALGEQLVYLAEIENTAGKPIQCSFIILKTFDPAGGLVDLFYLGGGQFGLNETRKKSGLFPIRPDCVDRLHSLTVESRCKVREEL